MIWRAPTFVYVLLLIAVIIAFTITVRAQEGDCNGAQWNAKCNVIGTLCVFDPSPGAGCLQQNEGCENCHRAGDGQLFSPDELKTFDPNRMWAGKFKEFKWESKGKAYQYKRFIVDAPGVLAKLGIQKGDVIRRLNYGPVTAQRLSNTLTRRGKIRVQWYTPGKGIRHSATLK